VTSSQPTQSGQASSVSPIGAADPRERWRNRTFGCQQVAICATNALLHNNVEYLLNRLHLDLVDVLLTVGVDTAEQESEMTATCSSSPTKTTHDSIHC
jgi:hypothetical protein